MKPSAASTTDNHKNRAYSPLKNAFETKRRKLGTPAKYTSVDANVKIAHVKQRKRTMEEVVHNILSLKKKYLFGAMRHEPVCKRCCEPRGQILKCCKNCHSWFHDNCIDRGSFSPTISGKSIESRRRTKSVSRKGRRASTISKKNEAADNGILVDNAETNKATKYQSSDHEIPDRDVNYIDSLNAPEMVWLVNNAETDKATKAQSSHHEIPERDVNYIDPLNAPEMVWLVDNAETDKATKAQSSHHEIPERDVNYIDSLNAPEMVCAECDLKTTATCSGCNESSDARKELIVCNMSQCCKAFHPSCCRYWPQAKITKLNNKITSFRCPSHVCQTCISDDVKTKYQHLSDAELTKCLKCPASYHTNSACIPAGSQVLTAAHIICPRHSTTTKSDWLLNVNWCYICGGEGNVVCCETCPLAVHADCFKVAIKSDEGYICEGCISGRLPLYGEIVWAKFASFRWWPAIILPPTEIPNNMMRKAHNPSDFVVRFFGSHDHGWINRRRVYLYIDDDASEKLSTSRKSLDRVYNQSIKEASETFKSIELRRQQQNFSNRNKIQFHPQPYVRIKTNRAVHPVKLNTDMEKVNMCNCVPDAENPCGPESSCINRLVSCECNPKICPAGKRCQNQMFQSRIYPRLDIVYMNERGFGVVCRQNISKGTFVIEYVGEVINEQEYKQRMAQKSLDCDENFYFMSVGKNYIIDAEYKGNIARFMNHSCEPNCIAQIWMVNGLRRIGLFAIQDIPANSELTMNYCWGDVLGGAKRPCFCKSTKCTGQIGTK